MKSLRTEKSSLVDLVDGFSGEFIASLLERPTEEELAEINRQMEDGKRDYTPAEARSMARHDVYSGLPIESGGTYPYTR